MIPKIIHYCWFGGAEKPAMLKRCIKSWHKVMPEYEIKEWNESNFDINIALLCKEAYSKKKYAFVADYCRVWALYNFGGVYLDTDVMVLKPFDEFLAYSFFSSHEFFPESFDRVRDKWVDSMGNRLESAEGNVPDFGIQSGVMLCEAGCGYMKDMLDIYNTLHLPEDLSTIIIPHLLAKTLEKYGYRYVPEDVVLEPHNIRISAPTVFSNMTFLVKDSYAWHMYYRSWGDFSFKQLIRNRFPRIYTFCQLIIYRKVYPSLIWKLVIR